MLRDAGHVCASTEDYLIFNTDKREGLEMSHRNTFTPHGGHLGNNDFVKIHFKSKDKASHLIFVEKLSCW